MSMTAAMTMTAAVAATDADMDGAGGAAVEVDADAVRARWLRDQNPPTGLTGGIRLFCFAHAGAGASTFHGWPEMVGPGVQVTAVQLPGHEDRIRERAHDRLDALLDELVPVLAGAVDGPYAFFGHSMGALIAYEAARRLVAQGVPAPAHVFASALGAPHAPHRTRYVSTLPEHEFKRAMVTMSGLPEEAVQEPAFLSLLLPTLRADFRLCETYEHTDSAPLPGRLTLLTGADDDVAPLDLALWRELSTGRFRIRVIDGGHHFVVTQRRQVAEVVRAGLAGEF